MNAVDHRVGFVALREAHHKLGYPLVGQQHKLFNELVGILPNLGNNGQRHAVFIQLKADFSRFKVDGPVLKPFVAEFMGYIVQQGQLFYQIAGTCVENFLRFFIRKTAVGVNSRAAKPLLADLPLVIHLEYSRKCQLVFVWPK